MHSGHIKTLQLNKLNRRIAIVHDTLWEYGGAERVLEVLLTMFPSSDLFTFYYNFHNTTIVSAFSHHHPKSSFIQHVPLLHKSGFLFSLTRLISWIYFYFLNLSNYDLIICSSHSFGSNMVRKKTGTLHVSYLHTTPRYLYKEFVNRGLIQHFPWNLFLYPVLEIMKYIDKLSMNHPDLILANSYTVKKRIKKYYNKNATVISPPVHIAGKLPRKNAYPKYYLAFSRLVAQKGIELIVNTCTKHNLPLLVVGEGYLRNHLENIAGKTIRFLGYVPDTDVSHIYANAKALLYCARDEDFGMVPVEAMAEGVPVVAYKSGGVSETIINGKTGIFFHDYSQIGLYKAIQQLNKVKIIPKDCYEQAKNFSKDRFEKSTFTIINKYSKLL
ncbi:MAG: hypothetical protein UV63_C0012G0006 [Microgenomates group bacterium GW2011_GWC1_43_11]|nr:MAG: hypothetical protein UV63_C0012G0006 [Microgenomates group bacterium GW2011_GWC1_43_11]